jgi:hypothetical protein
MPPRRQPRVMHSATPYQSNSCRIGTHHACAHSSPTIAPVDVPLVYEACACSCHAAVDRGTATEVSP